MASKKSIRDLAQIQVAYIPTVCKKPKTANVRPLYSNLKVLHLPDLIMLELAKYGYKISNKLYQTKLHHLAESNGELKSHRYPTHYKNTPNVQKHKTKEFNSSHLCKSLTVYNNLPKRLTDLTSIKSFTRELKRYLIYLY